MNIHQNFEEEIQKFVGLSYINTETINQFSLRINQGNITKKDNPIDHFCSMFLPYNKQSQSVFLVYHKKANDWIAPGGHVDPDEGPLQTVRREIQEELQYQLTNEIIQPLDLCIIEVHNPAPNQSCRLHYDFWYLLEMHQRNFHLNPYEFYDGRWMTINEALKTMKQPVYLPILQRLSSN